MFRVAAPVPRPTAIAVLVLSVLALAGCQKPNPGVTVWSGTASARQQAPCWAADPNAALGVAACAQSLLEAAASGAGAPEVVVAPGDVVGISVDPVVASGGWTLRIGGQDFVTGLSQTYYRFTFPEQGASAQGYVLQVSANAADGAARGHWFFKLLPR